MCKICEIKPVYEFTNKRKLCKTCFIRWFEKKFLYTIRRFEMIKKGETIGYFKKNDFRSVVLEELLKMFTKKSPIKLVKISQKKNTINKIAISETTDTQATEIIKIIIKDNSQKLQKNIPISKKEIKPLYLFLDKEVLLYAKLKKLKFKKSIKQKKDIISEFINELEKKHPEIKRAIIKSNLKLNKLD